MAEYDFKCQKCGIVYTYQGSDGPPSVVDDCICGGRLVRVFAVPGIIFRGSGFYSTDKALDEPTEDDLYT